jgi:quercetin dioxygenase-like cupin family protein
MIRTTAISMAFAITSMLPAAVLAEDAVIADPGHYTVEFENDKVRVIRIKYGPGEKSVMHTHAANVSMPLTEGTVRMTYPDGRSEDLPTKPGVATWSDAAEHLPENLSDAPMEVLLVELKN